MAPGQYDQAVGDLVNYLQWMGEPAQNTRVTCWHLGVAFVLVTDVLCMAPERRVLERRQVTVYFVCSPDETPWVVVAKVPEWGTQWQFPLFLIFRSPRHDGAVFRNNLPLFPPLPFVLFEKGMDFEIRDVDLYNKPEDISVMNPYGQVPILVERDLISMSRTSSMNTLMSVFRIPS
jgi:hypothetical protein